MKAQTDTTQLLKELENGFEGFLEGDTKRYKDYLHMMSKFHQYSHNNILLICQQMPDAQLVSSYSGWKRVGRAVKRGEKGIRIIAPVIVEEKSKTEEGAETEENAENHQTDPPKKVYFRVTKVFDISQTAGKALPLPDMAELSGDVEDYPRILSAITSLSPVPVRYDNISGDTSGFFHRKNREIVIRQGMSQMQTIGTLIHEIAHAKLHSRNHFSKEVQETEAESIAYVVCQSLGLDTSDYSFPYLASWSSNHDIKELKGSLAVIRNTADKMIRQIQEELKEPAA